jgi:hypothetical protein
MSVLIGILTMSLAAAETVREGFPPPTGAERVPAEAFGQYLGELSLRAASEPVRTHSGAVVSHHARVIDLPLVQGDLQQCADSAIRLHAEWQRSTGESEISYFATSGDPLPWSRYRSGERPYVENNHIEWRSTGTTGSWEGWLRSVFIWAGTRSLEAYETVAATEPRPGDLLVEGGSPGHAVLILDVAHRGEEILLLIGEGFMPAQDFHVELGPEQGWWLWTDQGLDLPHWSMGSESLRRWR